MKLDIVFVTYNSEKWLDQNINSILNSDYNLKNISLYYSDNFSTDDTLKKLLEFQKKYGKKFNNFEIIKNKKNYGFGLGNNKGAAKGDSDHILFLNIDTEIEKDTFKKLELELKKSSPEVGAFELRQKPYEHPKYFDPLTGYTTWASGACLVLKREIFELIKGFDKNIFMYCEDVDISWNIRKHGYKIKYLYQVPITHYSYDKPNQFKQTQFVFGFINNLYLRYKYGNIKNILKGHYLCLKSLRYNLAYPALSNNEYRAVRMKIFKEYLKLITKSFAAIYFNLKTKTKGDFKPKFINNLDYEVIKLNPFYVKDENPISTDLVSIIVRTCGRPEYLRETLISLRNQTYNNIEIVVVEDGENISENLIKDEFSDLNIIYHYTNDKVERCVTGNLGISLSHGKYLNFLDDDDLFFPDHVEILINEIKKSNAYIAYSTAFETIQNVVSKKPFVYEIKDIFVRHSGKYSKIRLLSNNITPIQSVMFNREVVEKCGGLDENIVALEDWDLWLRFSFEYDFHYVEKTTSLYRTPFHQNISQERQKFLNSSLEYVYNKYKNKKIDLSIEDINIIIKKV